MFFVIVGIPFCSARLVIYCEDDNSTRLPKSLIRREEKGGAWSLIPRRWP
jgi:hypothetical protein